MQQKEEKKEKSLGLLGLPFSFLFFSHVGFSFLFFSFHFHNNFLVILFAIAIAIVVGCLLLLSFLSLLLFSSLLSVFGPTVALAITLTHRSSFHLSALKLNFFVPPLLFLLAESRHFHYQDQLC